MPEEAFDTFVSLSDAMHADTQSAMEHAFELIERENENLRVEVASLRAENDRLYNWKVMHDAYSF